MPNIIVHQDKDYSQDIHYNVPLDWIVHHTPYGYMDRYGWLKSTHQFSNVCGTYPFKNQKLLFDGHGSHFDYSTLRQMTCKNIQTFFLKSVNSIDAQTNDNGPNTKLKYIYNVEKVCGLWSMKWQSFHLTTWTTSWLKHGMLSRCQMVISSGKAFQKQSYPPSALPT